ncbi:hypothetical protein [Bacillus pumilus]|uniref:hypothetical protein n=1 Tax=Bacillus pumilus TaxID=1408 RepID=UPI0011A3C6D5|nr:hypothetical protein [Bacillus pumilus]
MQKGKFSMIGRLELTVSRETDTDSFMLAALQSYYAVSQERIAKQDVRLKKLDGSYFEPIKIHNATLTWDVLRNKGSE